MIVTETLKIIKQRRSIRSFKDEQIKEEELQAVLEAGLYAPNAGDQAWHFTVIQNQEVLDRLNLAAKEVAAQMDFEHLRALGNNEKFNCLYGAPTLIIVSGNEQAPIPLEADCAAATQNLLLAAESLGLGSCWIFFVLLAFNAPQGSELRKLLKIPGGYKPYTSVALGYKKAAAVQAPDRKPNLITYIR
ncbi:nitroreductase family protein [Candidatus Formimonas warabiya]|uniref:Nitroreductase n=1 Tax=Formimonas warabiya TaxID=1761012 RepID=A0A3G1KWH5_FORW1|nr:nitroreductase family protein [Candidatus Formimonas warabiya]ATW26824.1 nitroreductase [Candidatus Formimonas warabiya]